ncbi:MAG: hypothetical protein K6B74_01220 [Ruminococcus sp.]|nr:hypothetical protein [Ruminococcus sp.]
MRIGRFFTNSRRYFLKQALWSVIYSGIAFMILVYAAFSTMSPKPAYRVLMVELLLFILLTTAYIKFGKKRLPEWDGKYTACSIGIMISSVPAALILFRIFGHIQKLIFNH